MAIPIKPADKVVVIGDFKVAQGFRRRPIPTCRHLSLVYDRVERVIYCEDCKQDIEPFDVVLHLAENYRKSIKELQVRREQLLDAEGKALHLLAAKNLEAAWRKRDSVPLCPSCREGLHAEDFKHPSQVMHGSKELSEKRREKAKKK